MQREAFIRKCGEAWGEAHIASGANPEEAHAQAERTIAFIAFYTGLMHAFDVLGDPVRRRILEVLAEG